MLTCEDCGKPIKYGESSGRLHRSCRGKRTARVNAAKLDAHGRGYFVSPFRRRTGEQDARCQS